MRIGCQMGRDRWILGTLSHKTNSDMFRRYHRPRNVKLVRVDVGCTQEMAVGPAPIRTLKDALGGAADWITCHGKRVPLCVRDCYI
jgi:hypothetical protein